MQLFLLHDVLAELFALLFEPRNRYPDRKMNVSAVNIIRLALHRYDIVNTTLHIFFKIHKSAENLHSHGA
jgi:hypothetical protein